MKWVTVRLLGQLGKRFFREERFYISNPLDAIRLITANFPDFPAYIESAESRGAVYRIVSGNALGRDLDELEMPCEDTLVIAEVDQGAGALGKVITGVALLGASFFMPASISLLGATFSSFAVGALGASLILGGVSEMLAPKAKTNDQKKELGSNSFGSSAQASNQSLPVPLAYGFGVYSNPPVISQGITVARLSPTG